MGARRLVSRGLGGGRVTLETLYYAYNLFSSYKVFTSRVQ